MSNKDIEDIKQRLENLIKELKIDTVTTFRMSAESREALATDLENILADRERLGKENSNIKKILKRDIRECRSGVIMTQGNKQRKELSGAQRRHIASLSGRQNEAIRILNIMEGKNENENK